MNDRVKNIEEEILSNNWYTLRKLSFDYLSNSGKWERMSREAYDRGNGATILLYNRRQRTVILTSQFRMPTFINGNDSGILLETCAGLLDNDHPEDCIKRETEEETGYRINDVQKVFEAYMSPGSVTELLYFFVAEYNKDMKQGEGGGLEHDQEDIEVMELPFDKTIEMMNRGEIKDAKTIILLQYALINKLL
jgi:GDP-mannose pyrophosphatase NudK